MSNNKLTFLLTNDNRPLREQSPTGSILEEQYHYAFRQINEYLGELEYENISEPDKEQTTNQDKRSETIHSDTDYNNNIFAFIGDRGSGKTSCMISVADFLINKNKKIDWKKYPNIEKSHFDTIDLIDPTYFDGTHNLISLFLAKLYKSFRKRTEENEKQVRTSSDKRVFSEKLHNKFLGQFQTTQEHLYHLLGYIKYTDGKDLLEYVDALSASVNLKEDINNLVDTYMEYMEQKDTVLILRIDDVDINEQQAGKMVETMRKYFIQPNILVLISFKLQQLENIKYLELKEFYERDEEAFTSDKLREMVDKYMVKLIPHSHRIFMPQADDYHGKPLEVKYSNQGDASDHAPISGTIPFASVRQAIPQLIFWKTRYLFYNSNARESYIVPTNLRDLRQLLKLLVILPDYRVYGENSDGQEVVKETNWNNKEIFKTYFFETWVNNNLPAGLKEKANRIVKEGNDHRMNSLVLDILDELYPPKGNAPKTVVYSPCFADVLSRIHSLENRLTSISDLKFLFFIKSFYSMKLYEAYDVLTDDENRRIHRNDGEIFIDDDSEHALRTPYQILVNGSMFQSNDYVHNLSYNIDEDHLVALMKSCLVRSTTLPGAKKKNRTTKIKQLELRVKWVELLFLCFDVLGRDSFDLGCLFSRLPFIYSSGNEQYDYFEDGYTFVKTILQNKKRVFSTLGDDFKKSTINYRNRDDSKVFDVKRWQSFCTIRNVEVLEGLLSTIRSGYYSYNNRYDNLKTFFTMAYDFYVESYDRDNTGREPYSIHFKFFENVLELFKETDKPAHADLKREIISILGDLTENDSEVEGDGNSETDHPTTPAV